MQAKISAFFKPCAISETKDATGSYDGIDGEEMIPIDKGLANFVPYKRRARRTSPERIDQSDCKLEESLVVPNSDQNHVPSEASEKVLSPGTTILNKKRSYAQYHLEFGQSDFLLHSCPECGLHYARGNEMDEKLHKEFHKNYCQGIQFKGWHNERVVSLPQNTGDRIILVLQGDPAFQRRKVDEMVKLVERDLGLSDKWLLHALCKVYLFISSQRIVGILVAEPIKTAHRIISSSDAMNAQTTESVLTDSDGTNSRLNNSNSNRLRFGDIVFQRQVLRKHSASVDSKITEKDNAGAIICEKDAVSATCGVRAIWVLPSCRRKHIATCLLDALRRSFCKGYILEPSECAFSQPTSAGRMFASRYSGTESFLVYHVNV